MSYLGKLSPTVGNGLGGMPERRPSVSGVPSVSTYTDYIVSVGATAPYIMVHKRVGDTLEEITNFGITLSQNVNSALFSPLGTYLVITRSTAVDIYKHSKGKFTLLTTLTGWTYQCYNSNFSKDEKFFVVGTDESSTTNNVKAYTVANDAFTPITNLTNQINGVISYPSLSADGTYLAVGSTNNANGTYGLTIYKWNGSAYIYLSNLWAGYSSSGFIPRFSEDSSFIVHGATANGYKVWTRSGDTFTAKTSADNSLMLDTTSSPMGSSEFKNDKIVLASSLALRGIIGACETAKIPNISAYATASSVYGVDINSDGSYLFSTRLTTINVLSMYKITKNRYFDNVASSASGMGNSGTQYNKISCCTTKD